MPDAKRASEAAILHICKVYLPVKGGVQKVVHSIVSLTRGHRHQVLTTGNDGAVTNQTMDGAEITRCRSYLEIASMPMAPSLVRETMKRSRANQLVCLHFPFPLADLALAFTLRLPPIIVFWHSNIVAQKKLKWLCYPFIYLTLKRAAAIVVTSEKMIENSSLLKRFSGKVKCIPYGISQLDPLPGARRVSKDYFIIVGRHVSYKGIDIAIRALQKTETHLVIAGDGPLFERHKLLSEKLEVTDKVTFLKNSSDEEIVNLINESTALIVPSVMHNEAFALVQLEAMRLAKPVINTNLPSTVPHVARHMLEGITVEPNNVQDLAAAMSTMLSDKSLAKELGTRGLARFGEFYTSNKYQASLNSLFDEVLNTRR